MSTMTKNQLLDYAAENDIEGISSRDNKSTIIETIEAAL